MKFLNVSDLAEALGMTERAVRHRLARRQLPFLRLGRRILVSEEELAKFLAAVPKRSAEDAVRAVEERS